MAKTKYKYNTQTLRYEQIEVGFWRRFVQVMGYLSSVIVFSILIIVIAYSVMDSPKEKQLKREISQLKLQYEIQKEKLDQINSVLTDLQGRDDNIYRVIFEAEPIPPTIRNAGYGGVNIYETLEGYDNSELMIQTSKTLERIRRKLYIQSKSYDELQDMIRNKEDMLASIPAIQPVANKDLKRMASGYGYRMHPIHKVRKMHWGMDFTAPTGTEIYSTGNGFIESAVKSHRGYGYHVIVNHGYGFKTVYAHMSQINVTTGQQVKRGEILGLVGNTGLSTAPHLHYEVMKDNRKVNPINYYHNDLSPEEFEQMIALSSRINQSFD